MSAAAAPYTEEAALFVRGDTQLVGVLALPAQPQPTGVLILVGGPQVRCGSHRLHVLLARALAQAGHAVLRFDFAGMGDSAGTPCDFAQTGADIAAALACLQQRVPQVREVLLWGLCDGASAALLYWDATHDPRVCSLFLANPWVRSATSLARTQVRHYYGQRLRSAAFWRKLLRGGVGLRALAGWLGSVWTSLRGQGAEPDPAAAHTSFQQRMARACAHFPGRQVLLLSGKDFVAREFVEHAAQHPAWQQALQRPTVLRHALPDADHTFSSAAWRAQLAALTLREALGHGAPVQAPAGASCKRGRPPHAT